MDTETRQTKSRTKLHFRFYAEEWLNGWVKEDLNPAERSVWVDFLCRAASDYGQIKVKNRYVLARSLIVPPRILNSFIQKALENKKICVRTENKTEVFSIVDWDDLQAEYLKKSRKKGPKNDTQFPPRGEERIKEENKEEERIGESTKKHEDPPQTPSLPENQECSLRGNSPPASNGVLSVAEVKARFVGRLEDCGLFPLDEFKNAFSEFFDITRDHTPDVLTVHEEVILWLRYHRELLERDSSPMPAAQLKKWFSQAEYNLMEAPKPEQKRIKLMAMLHLCPGYPFNEGQDYVFCGDCVQEFSDIDILAKTKKKIKYWQEHPEFLAAERNPREQLGKWFEDDFKHKKDEAIDFKSRVLGLKG